MLKIVIIDDEPSVLDGLQIFLGSSNMFKIVGQASDGKAAFTVIKQTQPDIVICDIRMPGLTGLELLEKVNSEITPIPKFIMLSGYNDFAYARKAMQAGTVGYMTKPLDPEELDIELTRVAAIIDSERKINLDNLELIRYTANQLYNDVINGKCNEKLSRKACFIFDIPSKTNMSIIRFVTIADGSKQPNTGLVSELLVRIAGTKNENRVFYNGNGSYIIIVHEEDEDFKSRRILPEIWSRHLEEINLADYGLLDCWVLISGVSNYEVLKNIAVCSKQLDQLHMYCMLHPESTIVSYDALEENTVFHKQVRTEERSILPDTLYDNVVDAMKGTNIDEVISAVNNFFKELYRNVSTDLIFSVCLYKLADVVRKTASAFEIEAINQILDFTASISIRNPNCKKLAQSMCSHVFQKLNSNKDISLVILEDEIIDYIKDNSTIKNLSIQVIAEKFSLPAIIISKIIKKKTGKKFNDYINYLRIEYAKMLFASEDLKITTVCDEAGYSDYGYFTKKFKEHTSVLPSDYKKKYS